MRMLISCMNCFQADGKPAEDMMRVEIEDSGLYTTTCNRGHVGYTFLQNLKYELLFDFGCVALINEYPREAVANFVSCIERFHEVCIKAFCLNHGVTEDVVTRLWKSVDNQSERQLGAFYFLFLIVFKREPPEFITDTKNVKFRNAVLHKGYIPKQQEAFEYGKKIFQYIDEISVLLNDSLKEAVDKIRFDYFRSLREKINNEQHSVMTIPTALDMTRKYDERSFEDVISALSKNKMMW